MRRAAIVDSTVLIDIDRGIRAAAETLTALRSNSEPLRLPAQAAIEYLAGIESIPQALSKLEEAFDIVPLTRDHIIEAARLSRKAQQAGRSVPWADLQIGTVAFLQDEPVVTGDPEPFAALGCRVIEYRKRPPTGH